MFIFKSFKLPGVTLYLLYVQVYFKKRKSKSTKIFFFTLNLFFQNNAAVGILNGFTSFLGTLKFMVDLNNTFFLDTNHRKFNVTTWQKKIFKTEMI